MFSGIGKFLGSATVKTIVSATKSVAKNAYAFGEETISKIDTEKLKQSAQTMRKTLEDNVSRDAIMVTSFATLSFASLYSARATYKLGNKLGILERKIDQHSERTSIMSGSMGKLSDRVGELDFTVQDVVKKIK